MKATRWHFTIISNEDNSIHSKSEDREINNGFGEVVDFEGYENESIAQFWAKDSMKLFRLSDKDYTIKTYSKIGVPIRISNEHLRSKV